MALIEFKQRKSQPTIPITPLYDQDSVNMSESPTLILISEHPQSFCKSHKEDRVTM